jgi:hypothetical protein
MFKIPSLGQEAKAKKFQVVLRAASLRLILSCVWQLRQKRNSAVTNYPLFESELTSRGVPIIVWFTLLRAIKNLPPLG